MRIIFEDVDGPLIPGRMYYRKEARYSKEHNTFLYDPVAVDMLRSLCEKYDAKIVYNTAHNEEWFDAMRYKARVNGLEDLLHEDCRTNFCITEETRIGGINEWLSRHPEVTEWIVFDDEVIPTDRQVFIDFNIGITLSNYHHACRLFGEKNAGLVIV